MTYPDDFHYVLMVLKSFIYFYIFIYTDVIVGEQMELSLRVGGGSCCAAAVCASLCP